MLCVDCDKPLSPKEIDEPQLDHLGNVVCNTCFQENFDTPCMMCGEMLETKFVGEPGRYVSINDFVLESIPAGIYKVIDTPIQWRGDHTFIAAHLEMARNYPADDEFLGHICPTCATTIKGV